MVGDPEVTVVPKRIGGSLAVFLPAELVKRLGLREGVPLRVTISKRGRSAALGALERRGKHEPFDRHEEGLWPDE